MKKKFIILLSTGLLAFYSCQKDKLTPPLTTSVSYQDFAPFQSAARIQAQVLGLYATVRSGTSFGGRLVVYGDIKGENWMNNSANGITGYNTWRNSNNSVDTETVGLWRQLYLSINDCNLFVDGMASTGAAVIGNPATSNALVAEARFLRAINYYALLMMYCQPYSVNSGASPGVPLRLVGNSSAGAYDLAPATVAQVFNQIVADLTYAQANLTLIYYTTGTTLDGASNVSRATQNAATALLTRVYLAMGQYDKVVTEANKIVSAAAPFTASTGVPYALQAAYGNIYKTPYTTTESIFSVPFTSAETPGTQNQLATYFNGVGAAEYFLNVTSPLYLDASWKATDARRVLIKTVTTGSGATAVTKYYSNKYATGSPYTDWSPVMRYAEVLLNLAEARSNLFGPTDPQAIALLNAVRKRSDATTTIATATIDNILQERNIEFLGEGQRWNDLWRLKKDIPAKGTAVAALASSSASWVWPVSADEQVYNKLIGR